MCIRDRLAAFYDLTGREPPPGVVLPDASAAAPAMERAKRAADARDVAVYGAVYKPPPPPPARAVHVGRPVCIGPFGGADAREDFARAYHGAPARVVSAGAELARACEYLGRVDAVDAERRAAKEGGARSDGARARRN